MKLLGANTIHEAVVPGSVWIDEHFVPYYKKPSSHSADGSGVSFIFKRRPKYRYVTVPKTTKYKTVIVQDDISKHTIFDGVLIMKEGETVNVMDFGEGLIANS